MTDSISIPDPFLVDAEALHRLATERVVERGLRYFEEQRVFELEAESGRLTALVEGSDPEPPHRVVVEADEEGELNVVCSCSFDWEPVCKHAIAALYAYGHVAGAEALEVDTATERALEERIGKGRRSVVVEHIGGEQRFWCLDCAPWRPRAGSGSPIGC